jgi:3-isopropylmalate/(R)-2-methylmalate dehydratase large subunit
MTNDASFPLVLEALQKIKGYTVRDPWKLVMILDHYCPSPSREVSLIHENIKSFPGKVGCKLYSEGEGICHQLIPEKGHVRPRRLVIGSDSHTPACGALNAPATGVGSTDLALAIPYKRIPPSLSLLKYLVARSRGITVEMIMIEEKAAALPRSSLTTP